jgi:S1-C subfamily serine protease
MLVAGAFLGQALGLLIGNQLQLAIPEGRAQRVDRVGGAVMGVVGVAAVVWLLTPSLAQVQGEVARLTRTSTIARALDDLLPDAPPSLRDLEGLVGADLPSVLADLEPAPDLGDPPAATGLSQAVAEQVAASTVRVEAAGCQQRQTGSGSVLGPDLVVTNAHVVAGADEVGVVLQPGGELLQARVVGFDSARDLAVLSVPGIGRPVLGLLEAELGDQGAVFGYPGGGDLTLSPFAVGDIRTASGRDIYGDDGTSRELLFLAATLHPGDSGAAVVDPEGRVLGVAFAIAPDRADVAYALTAGEVAAVLDEVDPAGEATADTGPCLR